MTVIHVNLIHKSTCSNRGNFLGIRERIIMQCAIFCWIRVTEVLSVNQSVPVNKDYSTIADDLHTFTIKISLDYYSLG